MATILICDDRPQIRHHLAGVLAREGHRVLEAGSGVAALEMTRTAARPELVLVNVLMPPPGGYQFIRQLHLEPGRPLLPVVFITVPYMESEVRMLARACGISHVVADTTDNAALLAAIAAALAESPKQLEEVSGKDVDSDSLYPMLNRLYGRVTELEAFNAHLERSTEVNAAQLKVVRSALDREVFKRLGGEQEMAQENEMLRTQSIRDPLTGLYNRRYLEESINREEYRSRRSGKPLGMMMIDIDHFKRCNDTFGHAAGDAVLGAVSRYMESHARAEDILCRYGGEEFVLVMTNTEQTKLRQRAEALHAGVPQLRIEHDQRPVGPITLSIGLAVFPENGDDVRTVLQAADAALYRAKSSGRDRIVVSGVDTHEAMT
jgi:diguanylate cyclase (GGDEF)-like protein